MKKIEKRVSLAAFAKAVRAARSKCTVCQLAKPLRRDVEAGIKRGVSNEVIAEWLRGQGITTSEKSVRRHRRNHG